MTSLKRLKHKARIGLCNYPYNHLMCLPQRNGVVVSKVIKHIYLEINSNRATILLVKGGILDRSCTVVNSPFSEK